MTGIPKLKKWKYFGKLFREHDTTIRESELVVFLRPEITTPYSLGTERDHAALCTAYKGLDRLNWPTDLPVIPSCGDPHCPYHNPRARFVKPTPSYGAGPMSPLPQDQLQLPPPVPMDDDAPAIPKPQLETPAEPKSDEMPVLPPAQVTEDPKLPQKATVKSEPQAERRWMNFIKPLARGGIRLVSASKDAPQASTQEKPPSTRQPKPQRHNTAESERTTKSPDAATDVRWPKWMQAIRPTVDSRQ